MVWPCSSAASLRLLCLPRNPRSPSTSPLLAYTQPWPCSAFLFFCFSLRGAPCWVPLVAMSCKGRRLVLVVERFIPKVPWGQRAEFGLSAGGPGQLGECWEEGVSVRAGEMGGCRWARCSLTVYEHALHYLRTVLVLLVPTAVA